MKQYFTPQGQSERLEYAYPPEKVSREAFVNIRVVLREDAPYAKAGGEVYTCQIPVEGSVLKNQEAEISGEKLTMEETAEKILIIGEKTEVHFDNHDYSIAACDRADYEDELLRDGNIYMNVDYLHAGLGGDNGWTKNIHPEYRIGKGYYHYQIAIEVI